MEKNRVTVYKPSSDDANKFHRETSAADHIARHDSSAPIGNLADVLKQGPVVFPNILAPDVYRSFPIDRTIVIEPK